MANLDRVGELLIQPRKHSFTDHLQSKGGVGAVRHRVGGQLPGPMAGLLQQVLPQRIHPTLLQRAEHKHARKVGAAAQFLGRGDNDYRELPAPQPVTQDGSCLCQPECRGVRKAREDVDLIQHKHAVWTAPRRGAALMAGSVRSPSAVLPGSGSAFIKLLNSQSV